MYADVSRVVGEDVCAVQSLGKLKKVYMEGVGL